MSSTAEAARFSQLFQNALIYTVSVQVLNNVIATSHARVLPLVILSTLGAAYLAIGLQRAVLTSLPPGTPKTVVDLVTLVSTLLRLGSDLLVQFSSTAVGRLAVGIFSACETDWDTVAGVIITLTLLYAFQQAVRRE